MLEKIGLPAKPAARGASWVLDASHCQGCSSAFSVFNRKHHCRRCGGIFCGNCTNQRLVLRGQGDNPVRICEPCKKLEESARFEARPWNKNKIIKGGSKSASAVDTDALLKQLLGEGSPSTFEADELSLEKLLDQHGAREVASTSGRTNGISKKSKQGHSRVASVGSNVVDTSDVVSPEKLRQLAQEEKKKYMQLKKDGRSEDALKAFKRSKELDRQADALELSLRKSKRKASIQMDDPVQGKEDKSRVSSEDLPPQEVKSSALKGRRASSMNAVDQNDDVLSALKELGWNDAELNEKPKNRAGKHSIDGDLAAILESIEDPPKDSSATKVRETSVAPETTAGGPVQMQILGHKRRALALKKEGKMAEAKEELKKAKILERQLEEAALLGEEDEEDDELAVLMRSLEREATLGDRSHQVDASFDLSKLPVLGEDDDDVDVSDADINDPAMVEALRAMGWTEEAHVLQKSTEPDSALQHRHSVILKEQELQKLILASKRKALVLRREGKREEAQLEFKRSKVLEQELQELKNRSGSGAHHPSAVTQDVHGYGPETNAVPGLDAILHDDEVDAEVTEDDMQDPDLMSALRALGFAEEPPVVKHVVAAARPDPQDTAALQQEILAIKRSALALKREGKLAEAKDQLMQSRALEQKLQMQQHKLNPVDQVQSTTARNEATTIIREVPTKRQPFQHFAPDFSSASEDERGESEAEVEESDYMDPDIAAALQAIGWQEDASPQKVEKNEETRPKPAMVQTGPVTGADPRKMHPQENKSRSELQKELLGLKRRALGLRREGKAEEADEVLRQARILESELDDVQAYEPAGRSKPPPKGFSEQTAHKPSLFAQTDDEVQVTDDDMLDPQLLTALQNVGWKDEAPRRYPDPDFLEGLVSAQSSKGLAPLKADHKAANNTGQAGTRGRITSWNGQARQDGNVSGPGGPSKPVSGADVAQEGRSTWDEQDPFRGEFGDIGETVDIAPPLFEHPLKNVGNFFRSVIAPPAASPVKGTGFDLLTGDMWMPPPDAKANAHSPVKNVGRPNEEQEVHALDPGLMAALAGFGITDSKEKAKPSVASTASLQDKVCVGGRQADPVGGEVTPGNKEEEVNENTQRASHTAPSDSGFTAASLQQEILAHKRMALALKREGKRLEATDALRQAKLLEQQLARLQIGRNVEQNSGDQKRGEHLPSSGQAPRVTEPAPPSVKSGGVSKEQRHQQVQQGKDRMKLQQESLAHKRKALGLRREGKTAEAEAEFELAKSLEEQMKDLEPEKVAEAEDVGNVDDIFDPQLMAALKGLGLTDSGSKPAASNKNVVAQPTNVRSAGTSAGGAGSLRSAGPMQRPSSKLSKDLEDRIRAEKVKAVQLKRAGKPTEAMNALREVKKLEEELLSITAH